MRNILKVLVLCCFYSHALRFTWVLAHTFPYLLSMDVSYGLAFSEEVQGHGSSCFSSCSCPGSLLFSHWHRDTEFGTNR